MTVTRSHVHHLDLVCHHHRPAPDFDTPSRLGHRRLVRAIWGRHTTRRGSVRETDARVHE